MKTSGVGCEPKFGLLGFLGHPSSQVSGRNLPNLPDNLSVGRQADVVTLFSPQDFSICHSGFLNAVTLVL